MGCGSIGRLHYRQMRDRFDEVIVVDPASSARDWALEEAKEPGAVVTVFEDLPSALEFGGWPCELAVLANWGPDHWRAVHELLEAGQRSFIVEKPLADSIADSRDIRGAIEAAGGNCWVNLTRRYSYLPAAIRTMAAERGLGDLVAITVTGGAKCLATNGIHFLDLALVLFENDPECVIADVDTQSINPRHQDLVFLGGTMCYRFPGRRYFTCTFNNQSSVSQSVLLYWRDAVGELLPNGDFALRLRDARQIEDYPAITRTGEAHIEVFRGDIATWPNGRGALDALYDGALAISLGESGERTTEYLLAALHASDSGRRLDFPLDTSVIDVERHWRIS